MIKDNHNRILVPTDLSLQSTNALLQAVSLAKKLDAEIHLVYIVDSPEFTRKKMVARPPIQNSPPVQQAEEITLLQEQAQTCFFPVILHIEKKHGDSAPAICKVAKRLKADFIVMGRRKEKGPLEHFLHGSTIERVVAHSPCTIIVTVT